MNNDKKLLEKLLQNMTAKPSEELNGILLSMHTKD
jgi:hypothetical protein